MSRGPSDIDAEKGAERERPPTRRKHRSHGFKALRRRVGRAFSVSVGAHAVRTLARTWRSTVAGEENVATARAHGGGYFMALWHGRMLLPAVRHGRQGYYVLVSASKDGDVSEALLERIGYGVVRGSTGRHGGEALRKMLGLLRGGTPIAITPDGPRGPPRSMNPGLAWMSKMTGFPVVPCGFVGASTWHLNSWDRFTIPKPFSRVAFVYEEPLFVPRDADVDLESVGQQIRERMERAERRAFELLGVEPDS